MNFKKTPPWEETLKTIHYKPLTIDLSVDILVIGAGIAGIATAYELSKGKKSVALIEKDQIGSGATGHTTAFVAQPIDTALSALISMFGKKDAKLIWESHGQAIDTIEKNVRTEKIDCEFIRCSYFEFALEEKDNKRLQEEAKVAQSLGFDVTFQEDTKLGFNKFGYTELKNQAKFNPLKYITRLANAAIQNGVQIFEKTEGLDIKKEDEMLIVATNQGNILARQVIVTTYAPFINTWEHFFKSAYYADYMMELEIPKGSISEGLYADSNDPYTYFRIDPQNSYDRMIIGGLTHRIQVPMSEEKGYKALESWIQKTIPHIPYTITRQWSGKLVESDDGIPYIGKLTGYDEVYVATAFSGNGMTYAHVAAKIFSNLLEGQKNDWANFYNAQRIPKMKSLMQKGKDYSSTLIGGIKKNISADATK